MSLTGKFLTALSGLAMVTAMLLAVPASSHAATFGVPGFDPNGYHHYYPN